jgi:hypothetical protein
MNQSDLEVKLASASFVPFKLLCCSLNGQSLQPDDAFLVAEQCNTFDASANLMFECIAYEDRPGLSAKFDDVTTIFGAGHDRRDVRKLDNCTSH